MYGPTRDITREITEHKLCVQDQSVHEICSYLSVHLSCLFSLFSILQLLRPHSLTHFVQQIDGVDGHGKIEQIVVKYSIEKLDISV